VRRRQRQGRHGEIVFSEEGQHGPARDQDLETGAASEQCGELRSGDEEMLEVVEHVQERSLTEDAD
jgi:hypothetical protein